jgi:predicted amidohydrolase
MRVAYVQMNCLFGQTEKNIYKASELVESSPADLYVLPELFNTGYQFINRTELEELAEVIPSGITCQFLTRLAKRRNCYLVAGIAEKENAEIYNSSVLVGPNGLLSIYRKIHLFDEEKLWFEPGDRPFQVISIGDICIGLMICFDWIFPEAMRSLSLNGASIICHSANLVLPYCQNAMITRCIENHVFAITANRIGTEKRRERSLTFTGQSQIVGPLGDVLVKSGPAVEEAVAVDIDPLMTWDKHITGRNHLFNDRRPDMYPGLLGTINII